MDQEVSNTIQNLQDAVIQADEEYGKAYTAWKHTMTRPSQEREDDLRKIRAWCKMMATFLLRSDARAAVREYTKGRIERMVQ